MLTAAKCRFCSFVASHRSLSPSCCRRRTQLYDRRILPNHLKPSHNRTQLALLKFVTCPAKPPAATSNRSQLPRCKAFKSSAGCCLGVVVRSCTPAGCRAFADAKLDEAAPSRGIHATPVPHAVRSAVEMRFQSSLCYTKAVVALLATLLVLLERHSKHFCKGRIIIPSTRDWHTH